MCPHEINNKCLFLIVFVAEKECGDPEPPEGIGDVRITGKTFGSKAIYSCPEKYRVVGMEERLCQADGTWSSSPPACKKAGNQFDYLIISATRLEIKGSNLTLSRPLPSSLSIFPSLAHCGWWRHEKIARPRKPKTLDLVL